MGLIDFDGECEYCGEYIQYDEAYTSIKIGRRECFFHKDCLMCMADDCVSNEGYDEMQREAAIDDEIDRGFGK